MKKIILLVGLLACSFAAQAMPIPWSVVSFDFDGTFTYDADLNIYSAVSFEEDFFSDSYSSIDSGDDMGFQATSDEFFDVTTLLFLSSLTNDGGVIGFMGVTECFIECVDDLAFNEFKGEVTSKGTSGVPEPSIIALFALGLLGLGFARRKKA